MSELCGRCHRTWSQIALNGPRGVLNVRFQPYRLTNSKCFDTADARIAAPPATIPMAPLETQASAYDAKCAACHSAAPHTKTCPSPRRTASLATCRRSNSRAPTPASPITRFALPAQANHTRIDETPSMNDAHAEADSAELHAPPISGSRARPASRSCGSRGGRGGSPPVFEEIPPEASGIHWIHDNAASAEHYLPETMGPGCAFLDYDNDGWMDIYLVNSGPCDFYKPKTAHSQRPLQKQSRRHLH